MDTRDPALLAEAEEAFLQALGNDPGGVPNARFGLAKTQAALGRVDEALAMTELYLQEEPTGPAADAARVFFCDLRADDAPLPETIEFVGGGDSLGSSAVSRAKKIKGNPPTFGPGVPDGKVELTATIDAMGCVIGLEVARGASKVLNRAALDGVSEWVFRPAMKNGRAVAVAFLITIRKNAN